MMIIILKHQEFKLIYKLLSSPSSPQILLKWSHHFPWLQQLFYAKIFQISKVSSLFQALYRSKCKMPSLSFFFWPHQVAYRSSIPPPGIRPRAPSVKTGVLTNGVSEWKLLSCNQLFVTPWTVAHQAPLSMECSRQEYCSGLPFTLPGYLPNPGIKPRSLMSPALAGRLSLGQAPNHWTTSQFPLLIF